MDIQPGIASAALPGPLPRVVVSVSYQSLHCLEGGSLQKQSVQVDSGLIFETLNSFLG